jgi:hypothetical protein
MCGGKIFDLMTHPWIIINNNKVVGCVTCLFFFNTFYLFFVWEKHVLPRNGLVAIFVKTLATCLTLDDIIRSMFWPKFSPLEVVHSSSSSACTKNFQTGCDVTLLSESGKDFKKFRLSVLRGQLLRHRWTPLTNIRRAQYMRDPTNIFLTSKFSYFTFFQLYP